MNKLFIIGNGFDLAHGIKTKYSDFLLWFLNKTMKECLNRNDGEYRNDLIILQRGIYCIKSDFESIASFKDFFSGGIRYYQCRYAFFDKIIKNSTDKNWVDIEYEYYQELLINYKSFERNLTRTNDEMQKEIIYLNLCLEIIKKELINYLRTLKIENHNETIKTRFDDEMDQDTDNVLFLVFNYTNTIELYIDKIRIKAYDINYIHGEINDERNPIIFGYGDEMDEYYPKIENLNINEYLKNMKSFSYLKTNNYINLNRFLNSSPFSVSIMGHSCGLSDRVLLNSIFSHENCRKIRIYYYQKDLNQNDYFEKTLEISRHFKLENKHKMRTIIIPFSDSVSLS